MSIFSVEVYLNRFPDKHGVQPDQRQNGLPRVKPVPLQHHEETLRVRDPSPGADLTNQCDCSKKLGRFKLEK